jgi:hypothetical protein
MDSVLPHGSDRVFPILGENTIITLICPVYTTNLFQAVDLMFFETLKYLKAHVIGEFNDDSVNEHITKLV